MNAMRAQWANGKEGQHLLEKQGGKVTVSCGSVEKKELGHHGLYERGKHVIAKLESFNWAEQDVLPN